MAIKTYHTVNLTNKRFLGYFLGPLMVVLTTCVIVWVMPRAEEFEYHYNLDEPWRYGQLITEFGFPVMKSDKVVQAEKDTVRRNFLPYYKLSTEEINVVKQAMDNVRVDSMGTEALRRYKAYLSRTLDSVYQKGIVSSEDQQELIRDYDGTFRLIRGNTASAYNVNQLLTPKMAYEYILTHHGDELADDTLRWFELDIIPNVFYDSKKSGIELDEMLRQLELSRSYDVVAAGEKIISRGDKVTQKKFDILESYKKALEGNSVNKAEYSSYHLAGQLVYVFLLLCGLFVFLQLYKRKYQMKLGSAVLPYVLIAVACVAAALTHRGIPGRVYALPIVMVPLIIRIFIDSYTAIMVHSTLILIISVFLNSPFEFVILQFTGGIIVVFSLKQLTQRSQILLTAVLTVVDYFLVYTAYTLVHEGGDISKLPDNYAYYTYFAICGILLLFAYPLLWVLEKVFGFTSDVTLVELSNTNNKLLQQLSELAPGTFQHSLQVANLGAEVANKIGGNSQLVRTGALYHDIGKMKNPAYFTENQATGYSPYNGMSPQQCAAIVIRHVEDGLALAEQHHLPAVIKRFISTHHGCGKTLYFYRTYKNEHPDDEIDETPFTYPGPNPSTKEEGILMMSDAVEAASRSLAEYTEESISTFVEKIIDAQVAAGFFSESLLTFKDIAVAKRVFKEKLKTIYHTRIVYPELKEQDKKTDGEMEKQKNPSITS